MEQLKHYHNGEFLLENQITYSINDVGLLRSYAVFDFLRIEQSTPLFIDDHLDRFQHSANGLDLNIPISRAEIKEVVTRLISLNGMDSGSIKMILTGGDSEDGFTPGKPNMTIINKPIKHPSAEDYAQGAALMLHEFQRTFPDVKSTDYLTALKLQKSWKSDGYMDVLYYSGDTVWEVSRSSVFFFDGDKLVTNKEGVLKGITAAKVLESCKDKIEIDIRPISKKELMAAPEVFITSTTKLVMPIVRLGEKTVGSGKPGAKTMRVREIYDAYVMGYIKRAGANPSQS